VPPITSDDDDAIAPPTTDRPTDRLAPAPTLLPTERARTPTAPVCVLPPPSPASLLPAAPTIDVPTRTPTQ
jgi:hypothetical protein